MTFLVSVGDLMLRRLLVFGLLLSVTEALRCFVQHDNLVWGEMGCDADTVSCVSIVIRSKEHGYKTGITKACQEANIVWLECFRNLSTPLGINSGNCFLGTYEALDAIMKRCSDLHPDPDDRTTTRKAELYSSAIPRRGGGEDPVAYCNCNDHDSCQEHYCHCEPEFGLCGALPCHGGGGLPTPPTTTTTTTTTTTAPPPPSQRGSKCVHEIFHGDQHPDNTPQDIKQCKEDNCLSVTYSDARNTGKSCGEDWSEAFVECMHEKGASSGAQSSGNCVTGPEEVYQQLNFECLQETGQELNEMTELVVPRKGAQFTLCVCKGDRCNENCVCDPNCGKRGCKAQSPTLAPPLSPNNERTADGQGSMVSPGGVVVATLGTLMIILYT